MAIARLPNTTTMAMRPLIRAPRNNMRRERSNVFLCMRHKLWAQIRQEAISMAVAAKDSKKARFIFNVPKLVSKLIK
jgi:hypothetical protein